MKWIDRNAMSSSLQEIISSVYNPCDLKISNFENEQESIDYDACRFTLNERIVISRSAKITPKKAGQFVTFWKRIGAGPIMPFRESDIFDFFIVTVKSELGYGQFIFPKSVLINKGIISTVNKEGKRAFRVYPPWDKTSSKQADRSQKWQAEYFYRIAHEMDHEKVKRLFEI